jgi:hypothetical protein
MKEHKEHIAAIAALAVNRSNKTALRICGSVGASGRRCCRTSRCLSIPVLIPKTFNCNRAR